MPVYGVAQAGSNWGANQGLNLTSVIPGEPYTLFDGTETKAGGMKSVAFARGHGPALTDAGMSFLAAGMAATDEIDIQAANNDVDAEYLAVGTIGPDASGLGAYTDIGRAAFYRAVLRVSGGGDMPTLTVQR